MMPFETIILAPAVGVTDEHTGIVTLPGLNQGSLFYRD